MFSDEILFNPAGGIDTDSDARAVAKGDYRMAEYSRLGATGGENYAMITSLGTVIKSNPGIDAADEIMGTGLWQKTYRIVYIVKKADDTTEFWQYDITTQAHTLVGTTAIEVFGKFYHFDIIDDIGKFTNGIGTGTEWTAGEAQFNPPFQLNFQRALDGEYTTINLQVLDAIKYPPLPPSCVYSTDQTHADNKLRRKLFRFRLQYIYENSEETAWSLWSNLALPTQSEFVSGTNWPDASQDNLIIVRFNTGSEIVKKINICVQVRDDNSGGAETEFGIFEQIDKLTDGIADNVTLDYNFYGNVSTKPISNASKNYDRLPLTARCQTAIPADGTVLTYTNFYEGYDKPDIDVSSDYVLNEIFSKPGVKQFIVFNFVTGANLSIKFNSGTVFNFMAGDVFAQTAYIENFPDPDTPVLLTYVLTQQDIDLALQQTTAQDRINYILNVIVEAYKAIADAQFGATFTVTPGSSGNAYTWVLGAPAPLEWSAMNHTVGQQRQTRSAPSLKVGATHQFGIVYGDRAFRDTTVITSDDLKVFVPWYSDIDTSDFLVLSDPFLVNAKITINHQPPNEQEYYWLVARKATEISDFSQWVINADNDANAIIAEGQRFVISLDKFYLEQNTGASINQTPQKGDVARFIRERVSGTPGANPAPYIQTYFELEVLEYRPTGGNGNRRAIVVERFDLSLLDPSVYKGQCIEIYTPRPILDADGNLFVAEWKDVSGAIEILNPHTSTRRHAAPPLTGIVSAEGDSGDTLFKTHQNILGIASRNVTLTNSNGDTQTLSIINVTVSLGAYTANLGGALIFDFSPAAGGVFSINVDQQLGPPTLPALFYSDYGDVYVRQRGYATGYLSPNETSLYWFIEDPHYSDYWLSDVHQMGRVEVEDPYAKQIKRQASIHSDVYFPGTKINGLSSFSQLNDNLQDYNAQFGEVTRTFLSGREDKTLKCIQERKENSLYIQHYPDQAQQPSGNLRVSDKTFAAWYPYKGIYGCTDTGGSILWTDGSTYYFDRLNGVFVHSSNNGQSIISERDPESGRDFKFRKKTKELSARLLADSGAFLRCYGDVIQQEIGFCFAFTDEDSPTGYSYEIYTFDVLAGRWRSGYDYNFTWFENFGETLVGFGSDNQLYLHNQASIAFHGESFIQKITVVSNDTPLAVKRYQDMTQRANKTFSVSAEAEANQSYSAMGTIMSANLFTVYEGYSKAGFQKNRYTPGYATEELAILNGEDVRAHSLTCELSYDPSVDGENSILFAVGVDGVYS